MKQEDRLLVALLLTVGILFAWTALFPPKKPETPPQTVTEEKLKANTQLPSTDPTGAHLTSPSEAVKKIRYGQLQLEVGSVHGGIRSMTAEDIRILVNANPGLLALQAERPVATLLEMETEAQGQRVVSVSRSLPGLEVTRTISPGTDGPFFSEVTIEVRNVGEVSQPCQLQLLAYHALYAAHPSDKQYEHGYVSIGGKAQKIKAKAGTATRFSGSPVWITAQGKSQTVIVQPQPAAGVFHVEQAPGGATVGWLTLPSQGIPPGGQVRWSFRVYSGPMLLSVLREAGLEEAFSLGFFSGVAKLLLGILLWGESWLHNYGLAILLLSFLIWVLFFPVTWSGIRMMKVMAEIQPQIAKLQKEHKNNPQKMNQEMMAIYKKYRVNPVSGCLPMLLQMPIFLALYQVLLRSPQLHGASLGPIRDLAAPDGIVRFRGALPVVGESFNVLPIIMAVAMFFQQRMTTQKPATEEQAAQQQIFKFMPILFCFLFYSLPSGLVLYWVTNTFLTLAQYTIFHKTYKPA